MNDDTPLGEARRWAFAHADTTHGVPCPCCSQKVKYYTRSLSSGTARVMIRMYLHNEGREYIHITKLMQELPNHHAIGGNGVIAHWWGLIEQRPGDRKDGSWRNGFWRLTNKGRDFVLGNTTVPKYVQLYNGGLRGFAGSQWSIRQALGKRFNYNEMMHTHLPLHGAPLNGNQPQAVRTKRIIPRTPRDSHHPRRG